MKLRLKEVRTSRGLSQNKLAQALSMTLQNVQRLEYGDSKGIQFDTLGKLCEVLECKVEDLLVLEPDDLDPKPVAGETAEIQNSADKTSPNKATKRSQKSQKSSKTNKVIQFPTWRVS